MKFLILLLGVMAGNALHAQQNELFNIEEHLKKKMTDTFTLPSPALPVKPVINTGSASVLPVQPLSYTLANNDVVYYGNGSMPCVKPDIKQYPNLANAGDVVKGPLLNGPMPNGALGRK